MSQGCLGGHYIWSGHKPGFSWGVLSWDRATLAEWLGLEWALAGVFHRVFWASLVKVKFGGVAVAE